MLGLCRDNEKKMGNYYIIIGMKLWMHRANGKMESTTQSSDKGFRN